MSMNEFRLGLNCHFSDSDKEKCVPIICRLVEMANLARQRGILALDNEAMYENNFFLKTAVKLIVDGRDPELIKQILQNMILANKYIGSELLCRLLIAEGVFLIQHGENPRFIALMLSSVLGEKYIEPINERLFGHDDTGEAYFAFMNSIRGKVALPECLDFETQMSQLCNRSLQYVLMSLDQSFASTNLIQALHGCGFGLIERVMHSISLNTCTQIIENWETFKPSIPEHTLHAQKTILKKLEEKKAMGEALVLTQECK